MPEPQLPAAAPAPAKVLTRPTPGAAGHLEPLASAPTHMPKPVETPAPTVPSGRELASDALAAARGLTRELDAQTRRLDPAREYSVTPKSGAIVLRNPVAVALEKQFGQPLPYHEESMEVQPDGGTLYRLRTQLGSVCYRSLPPNVELAAPGQGVGRTLLVPMNCP